LWHNMKKKKKKNGFAILEVVVGLAILALSFFAMMSTAVSFTKVAFETTRSLQVAFLLEEGAEVVKSIRDNGWTSYIVSLTPGTWYGFKLITTPTTHWATSTTPEIIDGGQFYRRFKLDSVYRDITSDISPTGILDLGTRKATIEVSWKQGSKATSTRYVSSYITNYFND